MEIVKRNQIISFTVISAVIGFMIAVQFQSVKEPVVRDTRDTWQLREDLRKEQEIQLRLIREIRSNELKLAQYENKREQSKEEVLKETLGELKEEAGLTEVKGPGLIIHIEPAVEEALLGNAPGDVSPDLLKRLVNELNMYDAEQISIDGHRIINTTVIRDINGETKIDGHAISSLPIEVRASAEDMQSAQKLYNQMQVSKSAEEFFVENLRVTILKPKGNIVIPAYQDTIRVKNMEPAESEKGGSS
ncbi:DUF881 domain-containing protein [Bacillus infantis]|nr:DUF881 domain-containing protein [Bacillus infantis]MCA1041102.1 DUF881 domain-containing protein [Bacillus infantis]